MALSGDTMAANIVDAIEGLSEDDKKDLTKVWKAIAGQIVTHIKTATVSVPAAGLTAPPNGGPVIGSASGTLS